LGFREREIVASEKKPRNALTRRKPLDRSIGARFAKQPYVVAGAGGKARVRVTFDRGARLDDARALVTKRRLPIARVASRACRVWTRARRPCTHHGCVLCGPLADRARCARRRRRVDACVRPVLFYRRGVTRRGTVHGGNSPRAARPRGDLCACRQARPRSRLRKVTRRRSNSDTSSPNCSSS
jgi:hypothetical protein